jgi:hypothetical protein
VVIKTRKPVTVINHGGKNDRRRCLESPPLDLALDSQPLIWSVPVGRISDDVTLQQQ